MNVCRDVSCGDVLTFPRKEAALHTLVDSSSISCDPIFGPRGIIEPDVPAACSEPRHCNITTSVVMLMIGLAVCIMAFVERGGMMQTTSSKEVSGPPGDFFHNSDTTFLISEPSRCYMAISD